MLPRSIDVGFLGIKLVLISVPLKSLLPLFKGQLVPFMLTIPLKSRIKAFPHILPLTPKLPLVLIKGTMFPLTLIFPLILILVALMSFM